MATAAQSVETLLKTGVQAVLLATADGLVIEAAGYTPETIDFDSLAAEMAGVFRAAHLMGRDLSGAGIRSVVVTLDNDQVLFAVPIAGEAIAVVLPDPGATAGLAPKTVDQIREAMHHFLELHTGKQLLEAVTRVVQTVPGETRPAALEAGGKDPMRQSRIALGAVDRSVVGNVITVRVGLRLGTQEAAAKAVGRDTPGQQAVLAGDATIRAMLELLPPGHAVELTHVQATTSTREALWVLTRFLSPDGEQSLFGIAPVQEGDEATSAAKAILNAVNRRVEMLLAPPAG